MLILHCLYILIFLYIWCIFKYYYLLFIGIYIYAICGNCIILVILFCVSVHVSILLFCVYFGIISESPMEKASMTPRCGMPLAPSLVLGVRLCLLLPLPLIYYNIPYTFVSTVTQKILSSVFILFNWTVKFNLFHSNCWNIRRKSGTFYCSVCSVGWRFNQWKKLNFQIARTILSLVTLWSKCSVGQRYNFCMSQ